MDRQQGHPDLSENRIWALNAELPAQAEINSRKRRTVPSHEL
ncbi:hypothetical protein [Methanospirillum sp.]|nr:hypothetical protein [Methanospirillum sp.]